MVPTVKTTSLWASEAMTTAVGTYTSAAIEVPRGTGYASILVVTSAGSLALTYEVSSDGANWYTPEDTSGTGLESINGAVTVGSNWIVFSPTLARYIRIVAVLTVANSTVSIDLHRSEEI